MDVRTVHCWLILVFIIVWDFVHRQSFHMKMVRKKLLSYESTFHEKSKECRCEQARYYFLHLWSKLTSHILEHHIFTNRRTISVWLLGRHSNLYEIYVLFTKDKGLSVFFLGLKLLKKCSISFLLSFHGIDKNKDLHPPVETGNFL
jgi:hypothetical protein